MAKKPKSCIGIDIGSHSIKIVEVERKGSDFHVIRSLVFACPGDWLDGLPVDVDVAGINLQKAVRAFGNCKSAAMSIPTSAAMVRSVPFSNSLKGDELWETIEASVSQYFPFSAEEVFIDFVVMGSSYSVSGHNEVLVIATEKDLVAQRELCADIANLKPTAIDVNIYALLSLLDLSYPMLEGYTEYDAIMIFDIGYVQSSLNVVSGNQVVYVRDVAIGGERLTQLIAEHNGISLDDAEILKFKGFSSENFNEAMIVFLEELLMQLESAIDVYRSNNTQTSIHALYLSGGTTSLPEIEVSINEKFPALEVKTIDPQQIISLDGANFMENNSSTHSLSTAIGLALRGVI